MRFDKQGDAFFVMDEDGCYTGDLIKGSDGYYIYCVTNYIELKCMDLVKISEKINDINEDVDDKIQAQKV